MRDKSPKPDDLTIQHRLTNAGFKDRVRGLRGRSNAIKHAQSYARFYGLPPLGQVRVIGLVKNRKQVIWSNTPENMQD